MRDYRLLIGGGLLLIGFFGHKYPEYLEKIRQFATKNVQVVDIKPEDTILAKSQSVAKLVTVKEDRINLAIFNQQFANRLDNYYSQNISSQQLMDLYLASAKGFFKDSLVGKYDGLSEETTTMFKDCVGELDHILSKEEVDNLKQILAGLSWNLSN